MYLSIDIAGSGDPLYVAELYKCWFYGQKSSLRLILFAKVLYYMREEGQDQLKGAKSMELLPEKQFFPGLSVIFSVCPEKLQQPIRPK